MPDNLWNHAHKAALSMEPIALIDQYVQIRRFAGGNLWRKVDNLEAIAPFQCIDMGAIPANTALARQQATNLDLFDEEFGQWRWFPLDNMQVLVHNPSQIPKMQLRNLQTGIDRAIISRDPSLVSTEICTWADESPAFEPINFSAALQASRIVAFGFRFLVSKVTPAEEAALTRGGQQYTIVPCTAIGPGRPRT